MLFLKWRAIIFVEKNHFFMVWPQTHCYEITKSYKMFSFLEFHIQRSIKFISKILYESVAKVWIESHETLLNENNWNDVEFDSISNWLMKLQIRINVMSK